MRAGPACTLQADLAEDERDEPEVDWEEPLPLATPAPAGSDHQYSAGASTIWGRGAGLGDMDPPAEDVKASSGRGCCYPRKATVKYFVRRNVRES